PGASAVIPMRMQPCPDDGPGKPTGGGGVGADFNQVIEARRREADEFYSQRISQNLPIEAQRVARQAYAGLMWSKQFYHYSVKDWLEGDPLQPPPPPERKQGRNADWQHLFNRDVISMP